MRHQKAPDQPRAADIRWTLCLSRAALVATLFGPLASFAQDASLFPDAPVLRLEVQAHSGKINRIDVDAQARFIVSGASDKTARVWDLSTGRLLRVLRVPLGAGYVGRVYAVAISPDGATVAVGGWTGLRAQGGYAIYLFDRASGRLKQRISGLPTVTHHLTYSPDGRYLAAMLGRPHGLRVYETDGYAEVGRDEDYEGDSYWADFDASGRLVTTCYDGKLRLYDGDFSQPARVVEAPDGARPFSIAWSPDGTRIAVGDNDSTRVSVLRGRDLEVLFSPDTEDAGNGDLSSLAWSPDGRVLYAGGTYDVGGPNPVRRWSDGGEGPFVEFKVTPNTIMDLVPLVDGRLVVGATDRVAVLDPVGNPVWEAVAPGADFRNQSGEKSTLVSPSGDVIEFGLDDGGKRRARFSVREARLEREPDKDATLLAPRTATVAGMEVTDWENDRHPKLNGKPLTLSRYETSRSLDIAAEAQRFLLGADWSLRLFAADGRELDEIAVPGVPWNVNLTPDGRKAIASFGDGTLRWYAISDAGKLTELLALYAQPDGRWVLWTPSGFYQASAGAEDLIGWHLNQGPERAPEFYGASRFREQFYRPDVVARILDTLDENEALALADRARGETTLVRDVRAIRPPVVEILSPAVGAPVNQSSLVLTYKALSETGPITQVTARIDGRKASVRGELVLDDDPERNQRIGQMTVEVTGEHRVVSLIAHNQHGASEPANFILNWTGSRDYYKPRLVVLAVGVSDYATDSFDLRFAAKDARDFVSAIEAQAGRGLYRDVSVRALYDADAHREAILDGLDWLNRQAGQRDVALVFLAGHGVNDAKGEYRFLPHDADMQRFKRSTIRRGDFEEFLMDVSAKTVLFADTCFSGNLLGARADTQPDMDRFASELADADTGVIVFSSTTGRQLAYEDEAWSNGAFTRGLLEAMRDGKADFTKDLHVSVSELEVFVSDYVRKLTGGRQKPTTAKPTTVEDLRILRLAH